VPAVFEFELPACVFWLPPLEAPAAPEPASVLELQAVETAKQENKIGQAQRESPVVLMEGALARVPSGGTRR